MLREIGPTLFLTSLAVIAGWNLWHAGVVEGEKRVSYVLRQGDILVPEANGQSFSFNRGLAVVHNPRYVYRSADEVGPFQGIASPTFRECVNCSEAEERAVLGYSFAQSIVANCQNGNHSWASPRKDHSCHLEDEPRVEFRY